MTTTKAPEKQRSAQMIVTVVSVILTLALWALDSSVPFEISMFAVYLVPIGICAHFGLRGTAYLVALLSTTAWFFSNQSVDPRLHGLVGVWNIFTRVLVFFGLAGYGHLVSFLQESLTAAKSRVEDLIANRNPLSVPQLVCERCQRIAGRDKTWVSPLDFVRQNAPEGLHACICPGCLEAFLGDKDAPAPGRS